MTIHAAKGLEFPITIVSGLSARPGGMRSPVEVHFPKDGGPVGYRMGKDVVTEEFEAAVPDRRADGLRRAAPPPLRRLHPGLRPPRRVAPPRRAQEPARQEQQPHQRRDPARAGWARALDGAPRPRRRSRAPARSIRPPFPRRRPASPSGRPSAPPRSPWPAAPARSRPPPSPTRAPPTGASSPRSSCRPPPPDPAEPVRWPHPPTRRRPRRRTTATRDRRSRGTRSIRDCRSGRATSTCRRGSRAATARRSAGRCTACCRRSTWPPAPGSTTPSPPSARPRPCPTEPTTSARLVRGRARRRRWCGPPPRHPHWREVYACTPIGDRLLEGYVDLLYRGDDGLVVVDHKTSGQRRPRRARSPGRGLPAPGRRVRGGGRSGDRRARRPRRVPVPHPRTARSSATSATSRRRWPTSSASSPRGRSWSHPEAGRSVIAAPMSSGAGRRCTL